MLILRDVLGCSAKETAAVLETSVPAVNSALQRARAAMKQQLPERRTEWAPGADATAAERELLERYVEHTETPDPTALKQLLSEDVRFSMPPQPGVWQGRDEVVGGWIEGGFGTEAFGSMRCVVTRANRQPAVACYVRGPATTTTRRWRSTCCGSPTAPSPRSSPSTDRCSPGSGLPSRL